MRSQDDIETATTRRPDGWARDKSKAIAWAASLLGGLLVTWGIWVTGCISGMREAASIDREQIRAHELAGRERDKAIAETSAERSAAIQVQLMQIQSQLADIQRDLRRTSISYQTRTQP